MKKIIIIFSLLFLISYLSFGQKAIMSVPAEDLVGVFVRNDGARIELILKDYRSFYIEGLAVSSGGNISELDYTVYYYEDENIMKYETENYTLTIIVEDENTLHITEEGINELSGINVSFDGIYIRE